MGTATSSNFSNQHDSKPTDAKKNKKHSETGSQHKRKSVQPAQAGKHSEIHAKPKHIVEGLSKSLGHSKAISDSVDKSTSGNKRFKLTEHHMSLVVRKPVFGVSDQVRQKPGCTTTEDGWRLEILDLGSRGIVLSV